MKAAAEPARDMALTPEAWEAEFGPEGSVTTPLGKVKMGEHQYLKLLKNKRENYFGMVKPTLERPDIVLEEYDPKDGAERDTKLLFVKTFVKPDGSRYVHFESVTVQRDNMEVSISSHEIQPEAMNKKMQHDNVLHLDDRFLSSEGRLTEPRSEGSDLVPAPNRISSEDKGSDFSGDKQGGGGKSSGLDGGAAEHSRQEQPGEKEDIEAEMEAEARIEALSRKADEVLLKHVDIPEALLEKYADEIERAYKLGEEFTAVQREFLKHNDYGKGEHDPYNTPEWHAYRAAASVIEQNIRRDTDAATLERIMADGVDGKQALSAVEPKVKKWKVKDFASKDKDKAHINMSGVYHHDGRMAATDSKVIVDVEAVYDKALEGKIVDNKGNEIEARFPAIDRIFGQDGLVPVELDVKDVLGVAAALAQGKAGKEPSAFVVINGMPYDAHKLARVLQVADEYGLGNARQGDYGLLTIEGKRGRVAIMGHSVEGIEGKPVYDTATGKLSGYAGAQYEVREAGEGNGSEQDKALGNALAEIMRDDAGIEVITDTAQAAQALEPEMRKEYIGEVSRRFDDELQQQIDGKLPQGHIYKLGTPGAVLLSTGVPDLPIELSAQRLIDKVTKFDHDFDLAEAKGLVDALQRPVAVLAYGDKSKAQNIIVEISHNGKNFVVGMSLAPTVKGRKLEINSIRNVFPKDNAEWVKWIQDGRLLYVDKNKIQPIIDQLQTNPADVAKIKLDLNDVAKVVKEFENPKDTAEIIEKMTADASSDTQYWRTSKGEVYGFVKDGKVYLDPELMNPETPVHEYTHLWDKALMQANPELWARGKELLKELPLWDEIANDPAYADIAHDEDLIVSEVHSRLSGRQGRELLDKMVQHARAKGDYVDMARAVTLRERIKAWLKDALAWVRDAFAGRWGNKELASLTVEEFAAMPVKDLARGVNPGEAARKVEQSGLPGRLADDTTAQMMILGEQGARRLDARERASLRMDALQRAKRIEGTYKERAERLDRFDKAAKVTIDSELVPRSADIKEYQKNALEVGKRLRGTYTNKDTGAKIEVNKTGLVEVTRHDRGMDEHMQSVAVIPQMIEESIYIGTLPNEDTKVNTKTFDYYLCPMEIDGTEYVAKLVVADRDGVKYYDHKLTQIMPGNIRDLMKEASADAEGISSPASSTDAKSGYKDTRLLQLLQISEKDLAKKIRYATGWERGADGLWRYEAPDFEVDSGGNARGNGRARERHLDDYVRDTGLFEAYPELKGVKVEIHNTPGDVAGSYDAARGVLRINEAAGVDMRSTMIHEVQHAIQHIEGFARGGNTENARDYIKEHRERAVDAIEAALAERVEAARPAWDEVKRINSMEWTDENRQELEMQLARAEAEAARHDEVVARWRRFADAARRRTWSEISDEEAVEVYRRIAGEVEARNAQSRRDYSDEDRREKLLEETEDVAREDQIYLRGNLGAAVSEARRRRSRYSGHPSLFGGEIGGQRSLFEDTPGSETGAEKMEAAPAPLKGESHPGGRLARRSERHRRRRGLRG